MSSRLSQEIGLGIVLILVVSLLSYVGFLGFLIFKVRAIASGPDSESYAGGSRDFRGVTSRKVRHLSEGQVKALRTRLQPFARQRFWVIAETGEYAPESEQAKFGRELQQTLIGAGWTASQKVRQRMGDAGFQDTTMYLYSHGGDRGLMIFAAPDSIRAGEVLDHAISEMAFRSSIEADENLQGAILIFIGDE
jgi:hypothetical protein